MTSNHLDISFVWKSLVASCVCVWLKFERTFSTCSSPARNAFVSNAKCTSPDEHKTRSLLAINAFACNVISYSEVNSRGYVIVGNKRVCLQCDILLGGE